MGIGACHYSKQQYQPCCRKQTGGFDKFLLDNLYEDTARQQQIAQVGYYGSVETPNPFDSRDPFATSNGVAPPPNVQMALMAQQKQQYYQQQLQQQYYQPQQQQLQNMMMVVHYTQQQHQNPSSQQIGPTVANPFGDLFAGLTGIPQSAPARRNSNLL